MYNIISTQEWQAYMYALGIERVYMYQQLILLVNHLSKFAPNLAERTKLLRA